MKDFLKKINDKYEKFIADREEYKAKSKTRKFPTFTFIFSPLNLLVDRYKKIFIISCAYSFVLSIMSILFGNPYLCSFLSEGDKLPFYCRDFGVEYALYMFIKIFIISSFLVLAYSIFSSKEKGLFEDLPNIKKTLKSFGIFLFFISLFLFPILSISLLYVRVPNPDWKIETLFFAVTSLGFLVPIITIRFYVVFAYVMEDEKFSLKDIFNKNIGLMMYNIISLFLILMVSSLIFRFLYVWILEQGGVGSALAMVIIEIAYNLILLLAMSLLSAFVYAQKVMIMEEES